MSSKSLTLREKIKETTTRGILDAAEAELAEHGHTRTSMNSIATRAGVSVGTLYNYFKDKEVLLSSLLADRRSRFATLLDEAIRTHESLPFEAQLEAVVGAVFDTFESHRNFLRIVLSNDIPKAGDEPGSRGKSIVQFVDRLRPLTAKGVASGVLHPGDDNLYAGALAALMRAVMIESLDDTSRPFRAAIPFVLRVFLDGARKRP